MQQFSSRGDQPSKGQQGIMLPILPNHVALPAATFSAHNDLIGQTSAPAVITSSSWSAWKVAVVVVALGLVAVAAGVITLSVIAGTQHGQIKNLQESGAPCHNCTGSGTGATGASGASGAIIEMSFNGTGPSGVSGSTGSTGPSGFTGASGSSGRSGFTGGSGFSGFSGGSGSTGTTGGIGTSGGTGASGRSGPTGSTGSSGVSGVSGVTGVSGVSGATGGTGAIPNLNGDVQGPFQTNTIVNLQGNPVNAMTPPSSSVLFYNNSQWSPLSATPTAAVNSVCLRDQFGNTTFNEVTTEGVWSSNPWINLGFGGQGLGMGPQLNQSWIGQASQYSFYSFWRTNYIGSTTNVSIVDAGTGVAVKLPGTLPIGVQQSTVTPSGVVWVTDYINLYALDPANVSNSQLLCSNLPYNTTCCQASEPNIFHAIDNQVLLSSVDWTYFNVTSCSIISRAGYFDPAFDPSQPWNGVSINLFCTSNAGNGIVVGDFAYCWQGQLPVFGYPHAIFRKRIYPPYDESYLPGTYFFENAGFYGFPISWFPFCYQGRAWPVMYLYGVNPVFSEVDPETGKFYPSPLSVVNATTLSSMPWIWSMSDTKYCRYPDYKTSVYGATDHGHRSIYNVSVITADRIEPTDGRNGFCPNPNTCPPQYTSTGNLNIYNATSGGHLVFGQNSTDLYPNAQNNLQSTNEIMAKRHTPVVSLFPGNLLLGPAAGSGGIIGTIGQYSDCRMKFSILVGTSPANSAVLFSLTFANAWTSSYTPGVQITAANAQAAQDISKIFVSSDTATGFLVSVGPIALTAATTYVWNFQAC